MADKLIEILRRNRELAAKYATAASTTHLSKLLKKAEADLTKRLNTAIHVGAGDDFQAIHARAIIEQLRNVLVPLEKGLGELILSTSAGMAEIAAKGTIDYVRAAEEKFHGIAAASSLRLREAMILDNAINKTQSSQLRRLMTSGEPESELHTPHKGKFGILQRYGENVVTKFEERLAQKYLARKPWDEVREELVSESPFLQMLGGTEATRWAERIVRTESAYAQNKANFIATKEMDESLGDMVKILSASFDNRTSADSYAVHGQIRRMNEMFESWYGAYMHPPNRPNDREVVIPHRLSWPIPAELAYKSDAEILARWIYEGRKGTPPNRPKMTTISLDLFGKAQPLPESQKEPAPPEPKKEEEVPIEKPKAKPKAPPKPKAIPKPKKVKAAPDVSEPESEPQGLTPKVVKLYSGDDALKALMGDLGPSAVSAAPISQPDTDVVKMSAEKAAKIDKLLKAKEEAAAKAKAEVEKKVAKFVEKFMKIPAKPLNDFLETELKTYDPKNPRYNDDEVSRGATSKDRSALDAYTGSEYKMIRATYYPYDHPWIEYMRRHNQLREAERHHEWARQIDSFLERSPKHEGRVYRGCSLPTSAVEEMVKEKEFRWIGPTSTSIYVEKSREFMPTDDGPDMMPVMFQIEGKSGVFVRKLSGIQSEQEVLMPHGAHMKITGIKRYETSGGKSVIVIKAKEVTGDEEEPKERKPRQRKAKSQ